MDSIFPLVSRFSFQAMTNEMVRKINLRNQLPLLIIQWQTVFHKGAQILLKISGTIFCSFLWQFLANLWVFYHSNLKKSITVKFSHYFSFLCLHFVISQQLRNNLSFLNSLKVNKITSVYKRFEFLHIVPIWSEFLWS